MDNSTSPESSKEKKSNFTPVFKFKEYYLGDYYLKLGLNNNELLIVNYNTKVLDGIKFSLKLNIGILHKASKLFKKFDKIDSIYDLILKIIDDKKFKLYNDSNKMVFSILPNNLLNNNKDIYLQLSKDNNDINNDYYKILSNEVNKLRNIIDILMTTGKNNKFLINDNSNQIKILKEENKAIKEEINTLRQMIKNKNNINNNVINISNINNKDDNSSFNNQLTKRTSNICQTNRNKIAIVEFNKKYNTDIQNNEIKELNLRMKKLGSGVLKYLSRLELNQLEVLDLSDNNISDISLLEKAQFNQLQSLSLDGNNITDMTPLERVNFNQLQGLFLFNNKISNINFLEKVNFPEL